MSATRGGELLERADHVLDHLRGDARVDADPEGPLGHDAAADVQLPDIALAAYDDAQALHDSVIANRRQYLDAETRRSGADLVADTAERDRLAGQRSDGMRLLASGGAIETLLELQRDVAKRQVRVEQLRHRYDNAVALESEQDELRLERQRLAAALTRDLAERQQIPRPAFVIFERLSQRLYADQQHGRLVINATDNGPDISVTIPRGRSKGSPTCRSTASTST